MEQQRTLAEELAACQDQLELLDPRTSQSPHHFDSDQNAAQERDAAITALQQTQVKFLDTLGKRDLMHMLTQEDVAGLSEKDDYEGAIYDAKERIETLHKQRDELIEKHRKLIQQIEATNAEAVQRYDSCQKKLSDLRQQLPKYLTYTHGVADAQAAQHPSATRTGSYNGRRTHPQNCESESDVKRRRKDYKHEFVQLCKDAERLELEELERVTKEECCKIDELKAQSQLLEDFGFPRISFHDGRGLVILSTPNEEKSLAPEELRSVKVDFDDAGNLVRAEPHPALDLWNEATISVEKNDLARLLTLVWHKVREQSEDQLLRAGGA